MDSESSIPATMLVGPTGYGMNGGGFGNGFGGDWAWILLLLVLFGGGWNNGFGGGFGGGDLYPWMNNSQNINSRFRDQMLNTQITSIGDKIVSGFGDISSQLCNGFNATQISALQSTNALQSQLAQCCCDNRAGLADLRYTVATEACADRQAVSDALRDVIAANTASTQRILDQLCADKIDAKNDTIAQLRQELMFARGQASQDVQTAALRAGQVAEVDALYNRLSNCPVPTVPVYGRQPIFTCGNNVNMGCGCAG